MALDLAVIGATGTVSMIVYAVAVRGLDTDTLPIRVTTRIRWCRDHLAALLGGCVALTVLGLLGLFTG